MRIFKNYSFSILNMVFQWDKLNFSTDLCKFIEKKYESQGTFYFFKYADEYFKLETPYLFYNSHRDNEYSFEIFLESNGFIKKINEIETSILQKMKLDTAVLPTISINYSPSDYTEIFNKLNNSLLKFNKEFNQVVEIMRNNNFLINLFVDKKMIKYDKNKNKITDEFKKDDVYKAVLYLRGLFISGNCCRFYWDIDQIKFYGKNRDHVEKKIVELIQKTVLDIDSDTSDDEDGLITNHLMLSSYPDVQPPIVGELSNADVKLEYSHGKVEMLN